MLCTRNFKRKRLIPLPGLFGIWDAFFIIGLLLASTSLNSLIFPARAKGRGTRKDFTNCYAMNWESKQQGGEEKSLSNGVSGWDGIHRRTESLYIIVSPSGSFFIGHFGSPWALTGAFGKLHLSEVPNSLSFSLPARRQLTDKSTGQVFF